MPHSCSCADKQARKVHLPILLSPTNVLLFLSPAVFFALSSPFCLFPLCLSLLFKTALFLKPSKSSCHSTAAARITAIQRACQSPTQSSLERTSKNFGDEEGKGEGRGWGWGRQDEGWGGVCKRWGGGRGG